MGKIRSTKFTALTERRQTSVNGLIKLRVGFPIISSIISFEILLHQNGGSLQGTQGTTPLFPLLGTTLIYLRLQRLWLGENVKV